MQNKKINVWAVIFWLSIWQLASMALADNFLFVSPITVVGQLRKMIFQPVFWKSIFFSLKRITIGFWSGVLLGTILAVAAKRFRKIKELLAPLVISIKTVPVASFIIIALIWFSSKNLSVFISFLMVFPILYTNVYEGIQETKPDLLEMAQVFQLPAYRRIRYIYIPEVKPFFESACKVSLGLSWKAGIAAEVIGIPKNSIGEQLQQAKVYLDTKNLFAWTVVIVILSVCFEKMTLFLVRQGFRYLERM